MFIRSRIVKDKTDYQVIESYRDTDDKVRHRNIISLGTAATVPKAITDAKRMIRDYEKRRDYVLRRWPDPQWRSKSWTEMLQRAEHGLTRHTERLALLKSISGKVSTRPSG